ncbi:MAG: AbiV family abortive infection protein [Hyphomicrobiales bacterium]
MDDDQFIDIVNKAIGFSGPLSAEEKTKALNLVAGHVLSLLRDALACFRNASFGTSVFLSITALEETAKAEVLVYRDSKKPRSAGRDPLMNHKSKHQIAVRTTTFLGRLPALLGDEACHRLQSEADSGDLKNLRELALYVHPTDSGLASPRDAISRSRSREMLLLALESADDLLVGYTNESYSFGTEIEALWKEVIATVEIDD